MDAVSEAVSEAVSGALSEAVSETVSEAMWINVRQCESVSQTVKKSVSDRLNGWVTD